MLSPIHQHVHERVPYLARTRQRPRVMPVAPDGAPPTEDVIDPLRHANCESLEATHQCRVRIGLDDQMHVIRLNGEVQHAECRRRCPPERVAHRLEYPRRSQRGAQCAGSERCVHRVMSVVRRSAPVRCVPATQARLSAGAISATTPSRGREFQLRAHLETGIYYSFHAVMSSRAPRPRRSRGGRFLTDDEVIAWRGGAVAFPSTSHAQLPLMPVRSAMDAVRGRLIVSAGTPMQAMCSLAVVARGQANAPHLQ